MSKWHLDIIPALFSLLSYNAYSQTDCEKYPPLPPVMTSVSVQPETGKTELKWMLSPSPDIAAYIVYSYSNDNGNRGDSITTLWDSTITSYIFSSTVTKYKSASYVISAMRLPICTSKFSNVLNTIFTEADLDTCNKKILVSWNSYTSFPKLVTAYSILMSVNGGNYTEAANLTSEKKNFALNDFNINAEYCFVVRANLEGGTFSTSNKACLSTKMQRSPQWINADYATIADDNKVSLSFTIDPLSQINRFILERNTGSSGTFQQIAQPVSANDKILYIDNQADIKNINYYRVSAINNCNIPITISNISSNIVLSLEKSGDEINLTWNSYKKWAGIVSAYYLFINTGKGYVEKTVIPASDSVLIIGYRDFMYEVSGNEVCFYISASEASNPYNVNGNSRSSEVCISPTEIITVPNVFTPDNDLLNDYFRPVLSFTPSDYHLIINDRQGNILFESRDFNEEWDGSQNGRPQPQGVCLWFLKVKTPSGNIISKTGTLTIIHNR